MEATTVIGSIDRLGYSYCADCRPIDGTEHYSETGERICSVEPYFVIRSDSYPHNQDECEMCHLPLLNPPATDPRPEPREDRSYWME